MDFIRVVDALKQGYPNSVLEGHCPCRV